MKRIHPYWPWAGAGLAGIFLPLTALYFSNFYLVHILALTGLYIILALGLNIVIGWTGLLDLGFMAFYGIAAYISMILSVHGCPFWPNLILTVAGVCCLRAGLGWSVLRLRGDYLAIVTLGFGEIARIILTNWDWLTGGPRGLPRIGQSMRPAGIFGFVLSEDIHFYYLILAFVFLSLAACRRLDNSRVGRAWTAIREDEIAAEATGIDVSAYKLLSFCIASVLAAVAGTIYSHWTGFISPESFTFWESVLLTAMVVLGGMGSIGGMVWGAILIVGIPELLRGILGPQFILYRMLVFGALMTVMIILRPQGLLPSRRRSLELHPEYERVKQEEDQSLFDIK